jgi:hypothetical protein
VGSVQIGECCAEQVKTLADTTWFTFSLLPLWSEEQGTVNCPCVTVILAWSALMTSYKPHRLVRVVFDDALIARAVLAAKVDQLVTLNPKDFIRLSSEIAALVEVPQ